MDFCDLISTPKTDVILHRQLKPPINGILCLTFSHILISERQNNENDEEKSEEELWVRIL